MISWRLAMQVQRTAKSVILFASAKRPPLPSAADLRRRAFLPCRFLVA